MRETLRHLTTVKLFSGWLKIETPMEFQIHNNFCVTFNSFVIESVDIKIP